MPSGGFENKPEALLVAASSCVAAMSAGASDWMRAVVSRNRGPAMLITPVAARPGRWTGAATADMPGANTSSIIA